MADTDSAEQNPGKDRKRMLRFLTDNSWLIIGIAAVVTFFLGMIGFHQLYLLEGRSYTWWDLLYSSLRLFRSGDGVPFGPKPWLLELARTLATIITLTAAIKALMLFFREKLQRLRLWFWNDHVVICGLGEKGQRLAQNLLDQGDRVAIIDRDAGNDKARNLQERGAIVLIGDGTRREQLESAKINRARYLFAVTPDDWTNLEIALCAHGLMTSANRNPRLRKWPFLRLFAHELMESSSRNCFVHLVDNELRRLLFSWNKGQTAIKSFNVYENAARRLFLDQSAPEITARDLNQKTVHLLIIGFGQMGRSVALQIARIAHYDHGKAVRVSVLDKAAETREKLFLHEYPSYPSICAIEFVALDVEDIEFLSGSFLAGIGGAASVTQAIVCLEQESSAHVCALRLLPLLKNRPIFVRVNTVSAETHPINLLAKKQSDGDDGADLRRIHLFGAIAATCDAKFVINEEIDEKAKEIHAAYREMKRGQADSSTDPAMEKWERLDESLKESNRANAEHLDIKLRAVDCKRQDVKPDAEPASFAFTNDEIELLAEMEHARWRAERLLAGWKPGPRDPKEKTSPYLVAWNQLEESIKDYDRDTVRQLPAILAKTSPKQEIVRVYPINVVKK